MAPFSLHYTMSRGQRLVAELPPWIPAIAGSLGFSIGVAVLSVHVSTRLLALLVLPLLFYRGLFALLFDLAIRPRQVIDIRVDDANLEMQSRRQRHLLPLHGIIQVYKTGNIWNVLHFDKTVLTIPDDAITDEQIDYLKSFALRALAERKAANQRD